MWSRSARPSRSSGPTAKLDYFGTSHEGRKLPLLILSDPPVATAEEATKAGKLVVMAFANIHAGEVDGKEALLALARDLTDKKGHPLLKDLVILLVPILNADGNEKIDPKNRPGENGPADGAGTRANAQGLDLNRDFVKLESPEVRALVEALQHVGPGARHRLPHDQRQQAPLHAHLRRPALPLGRYTAG